MIVYSIEIAKMFSKLIGILSARSPVALLVGNRLAIEFS
jgi:hypothetical protein